MRILYTYPEEWTGVRTREVHTLSTCAALARAGMEVTLVTGGGENEINAHLWEVTGEREIPGLRIVTLSRHFGPFRSATIFSFHLRHWIKSQPPFDWAYIIHLKAADVLKHIGLRYVYEAHEIFGDTPQRTPLRQRRLAIMERDTVSHAALRIATSQALAEALAKRYEVTGHFAIAPNAGLPPLDHNVGLATGPLVYCGTLSDWKGLDLIIEAAKVAQMPLRVVGGNEEEWKRLGERCDLAGATWQPRVPLEKMPEALAGARAGLISTQPESPSGRYSCPMKLFDYARCGLPVVTTALPSLQSLQVGDWCVKVPTPTQAAWTETLTKFRYTPDLADEARDWAAQHTWAERAREIVAAMLGKD